MQRVFAMVAKNILVCKMLLFTLNGCGNKIILKKYLVGMKKGCTFAAVFRQRRTEKFDMMRRKR